MRLRRRRPEWSRPPPERAPAERLSASACRLSACGLGGVGGLRRIRRRCGGGRGQRRNLCSEGSQRGVRRLLRVLLVGLAGDLPGGRVGVGFHRVALGADGGPARGAVEQAAQGLADVRQFVRDEHITGAGTRPVLAFGEVDVGAVGNRPGLLLQRP